MCGMVDGNCCIGFCVGGIVDFVGVVGLDE